MVSSINAVNGVANYQQYNQVSVLKPETKQELQALGINSQNIKTETQAQEVIKQFQELQNMKAQAPKNVEDMQPTQQVAKPENTQQTQAFAGSQAGAMQPQQPFKMVDDIVAQQNKLKLGLIK